MSFWKLADGTEPSLTCSGCGEPTPMTTHGLCPFCCDSGCRPKDEDASSAAEGEARQSGPKGIAQGPSA